MARRRDLRPEELELWQAVARTTRAMHAQIRAPLAKDPPKPAAAVAMPKAIAEPPFDPVREMMAKAAKEPFRLGSKARGRTVLDLAPTLSESLAAAPLQMDARAYGKMTKGKLMPEARIDLHGMTLAEAHPELIRFILNAHADGMRLVLVITGKGKPKDDHGPIPTRLGVLRHQVPQWLRMAPLGPAVLQVAEAHLRHGGSGAYYVYLRRGR